MQKYWSSPIYSNVTLIEMQCNHSCISTFYILVCNLRMQFCNYIFPPILNIDSNVIATKAEAVVGNRLNFVHSQSTVHTVQEQFFLFYLLTPWFMEPGSLMPHLQEPSNNPYLEPNQSTPS